MDLTRREFLKLMVIGAGAVSGILKNGVASAFSEPKGPDKPAKSLDPIERVNDFEITQEYNQLIASIQAGTYQNHVWPIVAGFEGDRWQQGTIVISDVFQDLRGVKYIEGYTASHVVINELGGLANSIRLENANLEAKIQVHTPNEGQSDIARVTMEVREGVSIIGLAPTPYLHIDSESLYCGQVVGISGYPASDQSNGWIRWENGPFSVDNEKRESYGRWVGHASLGHVSGYTVDELLGYSGGSVSIWYGNVGLGQEVHAILEGLTYETVGGVDYMDGIAYSFVAPDGNDWEHLEWSTDGFREPDYNPFRIFFPMLFPSTRTVTSSGTREQLQSISRHHIDSLNQFYRDNNIRVPGFN